MSPDALLLTAREDGVVTLTLNRPARLNALTPALLDRLHAELRAARDDPAVRAVVLTGAGRGFSAGADLADEELTIPEVRAVLANSYAPVITLMRAMEVPIVAAVNGVAAGAGASLALAADLRVAAESASFIQAFARIGLIPDAGATYFLPRLVGLGRAMEMTMLADRLGAAEALNAGLVNRVVPDTELAGAAAALGRRLAEGPRALGLIKRAIMASLQSDLHAQLQREEDLQSLALASADAAEGIAAFTSRRPPRFTGS